jgi:hypothetical protein
MKRIRGRAGSGGGVVGVDEVANGVNHEVTMTKSPRLMGDVDQGQLAA